MATTAKTLVDLEKKFWQSMVDEDADTATTLLSEPAVMVSAQGAIKFDHAGYKQMAENGERVLTSFELKDVDVTFANENTAIVTYRVKQGVAQRGSPESSIEEMNDTSTWVRDDGAWKCVMHTETPVRSATH